MSQLSTHQNQLKEQLLKLIQVSLEHVDPETGNLLMKIQQKYPDHAVQIKLDWGKVVLTTATKPQKLKPDLNVLSLKQSLSKVILGFYEDQENPSEILEFVTTCSDEEFGLEIKLLPRVEACEKQYCTQEELDLNLDLFLIATVDMYGLFLFSTAFGM